MSERETALTVDVVCPACNGLGGERWMEQDGSENGQKCGVCDGFGHVDAELRAALPGDAPQVCEWRKCEADRYFGTSRPGCRSAGGIADEDVANFKCCPYCGKSLSLVPSAQE